MRNVILLFLLIVGWTTTVCAQNEQETIEVTGIVTDPKERTFNRRERYSKKYARLRCDNRHKRTLQDQGSQLLLLDFFLCGIYKAGNLYQRQKNH